MRPLVLLMLAACGGSPGSPSIESPVSADAGAVEVDAATPLDAFEASTLDTFTAMTIDAPDVATKEAAAPVCETCAQVGGVPYYCANGPNAPGECVACAPRFDVGCTIAGGGNGNAYACAFTPDTCAPVGAQGLYCCTGS